MKVIVITGLVFALCLRQIQARPAGIVLYSEQSDNALSNESMQEQGVDMTNINETKASEDGQEEGQAPGDGKEQSDGLELMKIDCRSKVNLENEIIQRSKAYEWKELATEDRVKLDEFFRCYIEKLGFIKPNGEVNFDRIAEIYLLEDDSHKLAVATRKCRISISQEKYLFAKTEKFIKCING